jgi:hypothetical protein
LSLSYNDILENEIVRNETIEKDQEAAAKYRTEILIKCFAGYGTVLAGFYVLYGSKFSAEFIPSKSNCFGTIFSILLVLIALSFIASVAFSFFGLTKGSSNFLALGEQHIFPEKDPGLSEEDKNLLEDDVENFRTYLLKCRFNCLLASRKVWHARIRNLENAIFSICVLLMFSVLMVFSLIANLYWRNT